jgi:enoyl-CoA hydratase/carnithine racemase
MHRAAIGAGLCLATACDMRLVAKDAKMGYTFVGLGLHPGMGASHFVPQVVGVQQAARMIYTGEVRVQNHS